MNKLMQDTVLKFISSCFDDGVKLPHQLRMRVSFAVIQHFLGKDWSDKNIRSGSACNNPTRIFLRADKLDSHDGYLYQFRIERLSELLLNLNDIEGFNLIIDKIKTEDLEPVYYELDCAFLLKRRGVDFRFVKPSGLKGNDFDILISDGGKEIPCEIKSKIESTEFSKNTVMKSLQKARYQLPNDSLSMIVIAIPENWINNEILFSTMNDVIEEFMRNTKRVLAVVVRWHEHFKFENGFQSFTKFSVIKNNNLKNDVLKSYEIINLLKNPYNNKWTFVPQLIDNFLHNKNKSTPISDNAIHVKTMLEFLNNQNFDNIEDTVLVSTVSSLVELLLENKLQHTWKQLGNTVALTVEAINFKKQCALISKKKIGFACSGGAVYRGVQVMVPTYYSGKITESERVILNQNPPILSTVLIDDYLNDFCFVLSGHGITRRDFLKYLSNRALGMELKGRSKKLINSKAFRLLDNFPLTMKFADKDMIFYELLSIIQILIKSESVKKIYTSYETF